MESQDSINSSSVIHLLTIRCPNCDMIWLAPGLIEGDAYVCRDCGVSFIVDRSSNKATDRSDKVIGPEKSPGSKK
jgi:hypothetical protein